MRMILHDGKHVFSLKVQGSKHCYRDQDPEMHDEKLVMLCNFFEVFFSRVNCSLCNHQTRCFFFMLLKLRNVTNFKV